MNIYLVEYEDLDFCKHKKYFLKKELADNYTREIIKNIKDKIFNKTLKSRAYDKDRFDIELRDIEKAYTENNELYPIKFLEVVERNIIKRELFNSMTIEYVLFFNIIDKEYDELHERTFGIQIKTIEVIER
ncbi:MAG: hypothetical protein ACLTDM_13170 [Clostridium butyricum]